MQMARIVSSGRVVGDGALARNCSQFDNGRSFARSHSSCSLHSPITHKSARIEKL